MQTHSRLQFIAVLLIFFAAQVYISFFFSFIAFIFSGQLSEAAADLKLKEQREWDAFKDDNEKGIGNRPNQW